MWKRFLLGAAVVIAIAAIVAWFNRTAIITQIALNQVKANHMDVATHQPVIWQRGPDASTYLDGSPPPSIVFILLDDFGYNDLTTFGGGVAGGRVPTPNIDRLAASGAIFTQAYSGTGTCAPSRAMLMTGRYPTRTGFEFTPTPNGMSGIVAMISKSLNNGVLPDVTANPLAEEGIVSFPDQGLPPSEITIAEVLKERGYHTVHIGKWHLGTRSDFLPNAQGFNESLLMRSGLFLPEDDPGVVNAKLPFDPIDRFLWTAMQYAATFNGGEVFKPGGYLTDWWTDESLKVIEANKHRPFFLYLAHWAPHTPLQATKEDFEAVGDITPHRLRVYAAMIHAIDRSVGRVMDKLEEEGIADNTIIILSSDNGGAGYVGLSDVNAPYRGWKITLFEGGIRVPMFVKWPAKITPGTQIDTPVAHIDLLPTLAAAAGADLPTDRVIDGKNMLLEATGEGVIQRANDALFWQSGAYHVVRAGNWKLQIDGIQDKSWLFDLAVDPTEQNNLVTERPDKVAELSALLADHHKDAVAPLYPHQIESPIMIDKTLADTPAPGDEYVMWPN